MTYEEFKTRYRYNPATDLVGEGGFGEVFKAYDTYRDRWVAIKVSKVKQEPDAVRLKKEVEMVCKLVAHPNIAYYEACYTFSDISGEHDFGILQYYEQGNLLQLQQKADLTPQQKQSLLVQILNGIEFLHGQGIIHRDLKPQNILISQRGDDYIPKITDFGISKKLDIDKSTVFNNSLTGAGTLAYSSPEQIAGYTIRKNTDLWSFGVLAFQLLTGQLPFTTGAYAATSESGRNELLKQISAGQLPDLIYAIDEPWQQLIRQCMITDSAIRIKNVQKCKTILVSAGGVIADVLHEPPPPVAQPLEFPPRKTVRDGDGANISPNKTVGSGKLGPEKPIWKHKLPRSVEGIGAGLILLLVIAGGIWYYQYRKHDHHSGGSIKKEELVEILNGRVENIRVYMYGGDSIYLRLPQTNKTYRVDPEDKAMAVEELLPPASVDIFYRYTGQMKEGLPHGEGVADYDDKSHYEGSFDKGLRHGKGIRRFSDGSFYEGNYIRNLAHGHGDMHYSDGCVYSGNWEDDRQNGFGRFLNDEGKEVIGVWKDGTIQEIK
ncbi:MAG: protein kinase [Tannerella sp.]|jgi:serine/threonine protein kinase|nr:protein kinase [Tannerella sp.]